jgi:site-specific DNA-methyltransferase (adenine-specific)
MKTPVSIIENIDCMEGMKQYPDKYFDLAIVDPPYGIGRDGGETGKNWKVYEKKGWDNKRPDANYWRELFRVSKNQIVWGANYFTEFLPASMGWIFWDKGQDLTMSDGELAFSSFERALRRVRMNRCKIGEYGGLLHPTQKPVELYRWLLDKYGNQGDRILDTHLGSGSSRIAAYIMGFDFYGFEIDKDYFDAAEKRFKEQTAQQSLFAYNKNN